MTERDPSEAGRPKGRRSDPGRPGSPDDVVRIKIIHPPSSPAVLAVGRPEQFRARPEDSEGGWLRADVNWTSSAQGVASIDASGLVTPHAPGNTTITAKVNEVESSVEVEVEARDEEEVRDKKKDSRHPLAMPTTRSKVWQWLIVVLLLAAAVSLIAIKRDWIVNQFSKTPREQVPPVAVSDTPAVDTLGVLIPDTVQVRAPTLRGVQTPVFAEIIGNQVRSADTTQLRRAAETLREIQRSNILLPTQLDSAQLRQARDSLLALTDTLAALVAASRGQADSAQAALNAVVEKINNILGPPRPPQLAAQPPRPQPRAGQPPQRAAAPPAARTSVQRDGCMRHPRNNWPDGKTVTPYLASSGNAYPRAAVWAVCDRTYDRWEDIRITKLVYFEDERIECMAGGCQPTREVALCTWDHAEAQTEIRQGFGYCDNPQSVTGARGRFQHVGGNRWELSYQDFPGNLRDGDIYLYKGDALTPQSTEAFVNTQYFTGYLPDREPINAVIPFLVYDGIAGTQGQGRNHTERDLQLAGKYNASVQNFTARLCLQKDPVTGYMRPCANERIVCVTAHAREEDAFSIQGILPGEPCWDPQGLQWYFDRWLPKIQRLNPSVR